MTKDELIRRERIFIEILNEWIVTETKPIRKETFRIWRQIARRRLHRYQTT